MAAARKAFLRDGYGQTSMSSIAADVGGSKTTLWNYFPSKEDLFAAVVDDQVERDLATLRQYGLKLLWTVETHAHADHCGGNRYLQETTGCEIYASPIEAAFMENPILIPYGLFSASPVQALKNKYLMPEASRVDFRIEGTELFVDDVCFSILPLPGHSLGHTGIITPDEVLFSGDSLTSIDILKGFPFLYLADVEKHLDTLNKLKVLNIEQVFFFKEFFREN